MIRSQTLPARLLPKRYGTRVAVIGGSNGQYNFNVTADLNDMQADGMLTALAMRMGNPFIFTNVAVAGAESDSVIESQLPQLVPDAYDFVVVWVGGNDILSGKTAEYIQDNLTIICDYIVNVLRATPWVMTVPPASGPTATQAGYLVNLNKWIMRLRKTRKDTCTYDPYSDLIDAISTTNAYRANFTWDGTHTCWRGSHNTAAGMYIYATQSMGIAPLPLSVSGAMDTWSATGGAYFSGVNICDSGVSQLRGTSGTANNVNSTNPCIYTLTNNVPGNSAADKLELWADSLGQAGMACTVSVGTDTADGQPYLQLAVTIGAAGQYLALYPTDLIARGTEGKYYSAECSVQFNIAGTVRPSEVALMANMSNTYIKRAAIGIAPPGHQPQGVMTDAVLLLRTPRKQWLSAAHNRLQPLLRVAWVNPGTCTIRIKQMALIGYDSETAE
jgi:hypothetical protein